MAPHRLQGTILEAPVWLGEDGSCWNRLGVPRERGIYYKGGGRGGGLMILAERLDEIDKGVRGTGQPGGLLLDAAFGNRL